MTRYYILRANYNTYLYYFCKYLFGVAGYLFVTHLWPLLRCRSVVGALQRPHCLRLEIDLIGIHRIVETLDRVLLVTGHSAFF